MKEGEASIFKPEGCEYQLVARVQMENWPKLAVAVQRTHGSSGSPRVHAYFVSPNGSHLPPMYTCRATAAN